MAAECLLRAFLISQAESFTLSPGKHTCRPVLQRLPTADSPTSSHSSLLFVCTFSAPSISIQFNPYFSSTLTSLFPLYFALFRPQHSMIPIFLPQSSPPWLLLFLYVGPFLSPLKPLVFLKFISKFQTRTVPSISSKSFSLTVQSFPSYSQALIHCQYSVAFSCFQN